MKTATRRSQSLVQGVVSHPRRGDAGAWRRADGPCPGDAGRRLHAARRHARRSRSARSSSRTTPTSRSRRPPTRPATPSTRVRSTSPAPTSTSPATSRTSSRSGSRRTSPGSAWPGNSLDGSMTYRLKYAYAQINLDDWLPKGSWVRFGMQQTPFIDSIEGIYRYRFQGTIFAEREGYMSSADVGVDLPHDVPQQLRRRPRRLLQRRGLLEGRGEQQEGVHGPRRLQAAAAPPDPEGLAPPGVLDAGQLHGERPAEPHGLQHDLRTPLRQRRASTTSTRPDKVSSAPTNGVDLYPTLDGKGWSFWATPKKVFPNGSSIEALIRYDHMKPGGTASATADHVAGRPERADDRRRRLLVPEAGQRVGRAPVRRRERDVLELDAGQADAAADLRAHA